MQLATFRPRLAAFCPLVPSCPHETTHAGPHTDVCRPQATACAPGRCYCPPTPVPDPPPLRGPRWGRYGQASAELVEDLAAELREHLAALRSTAEEGHRPC